METVKRKRDEKYEEDDDEFFFDSEDFVDGMAPWKRHKQEVDDSSEEDDDDFFFDSEDFVDGMAPWKRHEQEDDDSSEEEDDPNQAYYAAARQMFEAGQALEQIEASRNVYYNFWDEAESKLWATAVAA